MWTIKLRYYLGLTILIVSEAVSAGNLNGEWRVDIDKTRHFSETFFKKSDTQMAIFNCMIGRSKLYIEDKKIAFIIEEHTCKHAGKEGVISGVIDNFEYEVIHSGQAQDALLLTSKDKNKAVQVIHWLGEDSFWLDESDADSVSRYYYHRVVQKQD